MTDKDTTIRGPSETRGKLSQLWTILRLLLLPLLGLSLGAIGLAWLNEIIDRYFFPAEVAVDFYGFVALGREMFGVLLGLTTGLALAFRWNGNREAASYVCLWGGGLAFAEITLQTFGAGGSWLHTVLFYDNLALLWAVLLFGVGIRLRKKDLALEHVAPGGDMARS